MALIENTKCDCGHNNPVGTVLCESCGKPILEQDQQATTPLDMRYEGMSRRSQLADKTIIDQVWSFFSSVKIAIYMIIIILIASAIGTVLPQENQFLPGINHEKFYIDTYGWFGKLYYESGLSNTFNSWWFSLLLLMLGTSLVICSLDRVIPLHKALKKQRAKKNPQFILRQKIQTTLEEADLRQSPESYMNAMEEQLKKKRYQVIREKDALLAEKGRFSRWGPYINHIGLIIFLLAALLRNIPGWYEDHMIRIMENEIVSVPGTSYFIENEKFTLEFYDPATLPDALKQEGSERVTPKLYQTDAILYECTGDCYTTTPQLKELIRHPITVNDPLRYEGLKFFQIDFELGKLKSVDVKLAHEETGQVFGQFNLDFYDPGTEFSVGEYQVSVVQYFPDFEIEMNGDTPTLITKSRVPNNPAFTFKVTGPLSPKGDVVLYAPLNKPISDKINDTLGAQYSIAGTMQDVHFVNSTTLNYRVEKALPFFFVGAFISMIGLVMGFYWQHRRIWINEVDGKILLGAHTNKNGFGLRQDIVDTSSKVGVVIPMEQLKDGVKVK
jgi:cytochrome c biogenesis protein